MLAATGEVAPQADVWYSRARETELLRGATWRRAPRHAPSRTTRCGLIRGERNRKCPARAIGTRVTGSIHPNTEGLILPHRVCAPYGLVISPATAKTHVSRTMLKLHAHDRAQLVVIAYESGLIRVPH